MQFKVETFEKILPKSEEALEKYLVSSKIKGVGKATAKAIVKEFGEETVNILRYEYDKLVKIKGINLEKAEKMSQSFNENWEVWQIVKVLEKFGAGIENAKRLYDQYGINTCRQIEENPYMLIENARNISFKKVDEIALKDGIKYNDPKRIRSGIKYGIIKATYNGHCCVLKENLIEYVIGLLDVTTEEIENEIISLKVKNEIVVRKIDDEKWIYLKNFYDAEENVATRIIELDNQKNKKKIKSIENEIKQVEQNLNIELSEKQKEAVKAIDKNNVTIITGGPRNR